MITSVHNSFTLSSITIYISILIFCSGMMGQYFLFPFHDSKPKFPEKFHASQYRSVCVEDIRNYTKSILIVFFECNWPLYYKVIYESVKWNAFFNYNEHQTNYETLSNLDIFVAFKFRQPRFSDTIEIFIRISNEIWICYIVCSVLNDAGLLSMSVLNL